MHIHSYSRVRHRLDTGDIILFSRKNVFMIVWQWLTDCRWTHVGMAIRCDGTDDALLWESTTLSNLRDHLTGRAREGVQVVRLGERIRTYKGDVAFRKLRLPPGLQPPGRLTARIHQFRKTIHGRPFERNLCELLGAFIDLSTDRLRGQGQQTGRARRLKPRTGDRADRRRSRSSLFCSELVAAAYQEMGLLDPSVKPANEYTPRDFTSSAADRDLPLAASLGAEQQIVYP